MTRNPQYRRHVGECATLEPPLRREEQATCDSRTFYTQGRKGGT